MMNQRVVGVIVLALLAGSRGSAQTDLLVRIVAPAPNAFVSDRMTLEARIEPAARRTEVVEVLFFADGVQVCRSVDVQRPLCSWDAGATIKSHVIRVVATLASGARAVASTRTRGIDLADSISVRAVQVNVSVLDRRGAYVRGLTRDRFRVREDGVPQTITHFADETSPLELVLAIDVSGSMEPVVDDLKDAVRQFLSQLRPVDQVTVVAFNDEMFTLARRDAEPATRERAVDALAAWGGTALYDAVGRALELLGRQPGRRGLVVFSDGGDSSSQTTLQAVERVIQASDATLFSVALGRGRESQEHRDTLEALADASGGRMVTAQGADDLRRAFGEVLRDLQHQYLIAYQPGNATLDGTWRRLSVEVPGAGYRVRARAGYLAVAP